jgi:hypothetical protein
VPKQCIIMSIMEGAEQVLVVFLSGALALFLVLGIIVLVKIIQLIRMIKHLIDRAELLVDKAESVGEFLEKSVTTLTFGRLFTSMASKFTRKKRRK